MSACRTHPQGWGPAETLSCPGLVLSASPCPLAQGLCPPSLPGFVTLSRPSLLPPLIALSFCSLKYNLHTLKLKCRCSKGNFINLDKYTHVCKHPLPPTTEMRNVPRAQEAPHDLSTYPPPQATATLLPAPTRPFSHSRSLTRMQSHGTQSWGRFLNPPHFCTRFPSWELQAVLFSLRNIRVCGVSHLLSWALLDGHWAAPI